METPLLQTKLYIPPPRPELVPRPRLIERLNEGLHRKLTLTSAPAGFGKTTVVCSWLNGLEVAPDPLKVDLEPGPRLQTSPITSAAWLSLDENDNDLTRFFTYLVATLQQIEPSIGQHGFLIKSHSG